MINFIFIFCWIFIEILMLVLIFENLKELPKKIDGYQHCENCQFEN
jgi:hypothetical protein